MKSDEGNKKADSEDIFTLMQRIKELELELARAKVAQVEAECQNQNLKHQLLNLTNPAANQKAPLQHNSSWKSKWDNVVNSMNIPIPNMATMNIPTFQSHLTDLTHFTAEDAK